MNLLLFLITIVISFVVVRIGAIAFELTGLEWSLAKFQALSCFSGTGFTTREAELVVGNPQRRRIASILMILGNAGLVTLVATFANSLQPSLYLPKFNIPFLRLGIPSGFVPVFNLAVIVLSLYVIYRFFSHVRVARKITDLIRHRLVKNKVFEPVSFEELMISTAGYGIVSMVACPGSPVVNKLLKEGRLRRLDINLLVIERADRTIVNPPADTMIMPGDRLICFGKLEKIRKELCEALV